MRHLRWLERENLLESAAMDVLSYGYFQSAVFDPVECVLAESGKKLQPMNRSQGS